LTLQQQLFSHQEMPANETKGEKDTSKQIHRNIDVLRATIVNVTWDNQQV